MLKNEEAIPRFRANYGSDVRIYRDQSRSTTSNLL